MLTTGILDDCAILILSCDKYSDLWTPFFRQWQKHWATCPYTVYLGSNQKLYEAAGVSTLLSGEDRDWSSSFLAILQKIPQRFLFVWLEDAFLSGPVDTQRMELGFQALGSLGAHHIHFRPVPAPEEWQEGGTLGRYAPRMPYRANVVGFWNKQYLEQLLLKGENPWNFEIMGSYRSSYDDGFYCLRLKPFEYLDVVDKGRWIPSALRYCNMHGIALDVVRRPMLGLGDRFQYQGKVLLFRGMSAIPWQVRVHCMNFLRKLLASY